MGKREHLALAAARTSKPVRKPTPAQRPLLPQADGVTVADLLERLGNIPPQRVRLYPTPGTATEDDVIRVLDRENVPCELIEGTLVEKAMGVEESIIAGLLITFLNQFVLPIKQIFGAKKP
jgi:hypothetical protein